MMDYIFPLTITSAPSNNIILRSLGSTPKNISLWPEGSITVVQNLVGADNLDAYDPDPVQSDIIVPPPDMTYYMFFGTNNSDTDDAGLLQSSILGNPGNTPPPPPGGTLVHNLPFLTTMGQLRSM